MLDRSGSISSANWVLEKRFAKDLMTEIMISPDGSRGGVVTFADFATKEIFCNQHTSTALINAAINGLTQHGELTNIQDGLEKGQEVLLERGCGERTAIRNRIIILITDGVANRGKDQNGPIEPAKQIRNTGTIIFAVGVGDAKRTELEGVTGNTERVFFEDTFGDLLKAGVISNLTREICKLTTTPVATTTPGTTTTTTTTTTTPKPTTTTTTTTTPKPTTTTTTTRGPKGMSNYF